MASGDTTAVGTESVQRFALQGGIALGIFTGLVFVGIFLRSEALIRETVVASASSYIDLIVDTRMWNASHGGVWVAKTATTQENPYLRRLGVEPDTQTVSGSMLTMRNPSAMTSEISVISEEEGRVSFRLTSLKPVNPDHAPDAWERATLERFEVDGAEASQVQNVGDTRTLRLMRPLIVDSTCLQCHGKQGYQVGDTRGAISVTVPLGPTDRIVRRNALTLLGIWFAVMVIGGLSMGALVRRMSARIEVYEDRLLDLATTDSLTGLANRRAVLERLEIELARSEREGSTVGVISLDIDHFKRVNDGWGHAAGDVVLRGVTARAADAVREYDVLGRIGGEEFLVVAPAITLEGLGALAERLRSAVADTPISDDSIDHAVTVSLGIALSRPGEGLDALLDRADTALYAAKEGGRNRVNLG